MSSQTVEVDVGGVRAGNGGNVGSFGELGDAWLAEGVTFRLDVRSPLLFFAS